MPHVTELLFYRLTSGVLLVRYEQHRRNPNIPADEHPHTLALAPRGTTPPNLTQLPHTIDDEVTTWIVFPDPWTEQNAVLVQTLLQSSRDDVKRIGERAQQGASLLRAQLDS